MIKMHRGYCIIRTFSKDEKSEGLKFVPALICPHLKIAVHKAKYRIGYTVTDMSTGLGVLTYSTLKAARDAIENGHYFNAINKYIATHNDYNNKKECFNNLIHKYHNNLYKGDYKDVFNFDDINNKYYW